MLSCFRRRYPDCVAVIAPIWSKGVCVYKMQTEAILMNYRCHSGAGSLKLLQGARYKLESISKDRESLTLSCNGSIPQIGRGNLHIYRQACIHRILYALRRIYTYNDS